MSAIPKLNIVRPSLAYTKLPDDGLVSRLNAVHDGMAGNSAYPTPPVDEPSFKAAIAGYTASIAAALDGSKKAIADRQQKRADVITMMRTLGHYVEVTCKGDMNTFLSSGFEASTFARTAPQPLPKPSILRVDQGNSGQLLVTLKALPKARSFELRYAQLGAGNSPGPWTTLTVATIKVAIGIGGLAPGTTYTFQVRAFGNLGFTDWSDSINRMTI